MQVVQTKVGEEGGLEHETKTKIKNNPTAIYSEVLKVHNQIEGWKFFSFLQSFSGSPVHGFEIYFLSRSLQPLF